MKAEGKTIREIAAHAGMTNTLTSFLLRDKEVSE